MRIVAGSRRGTRLVAPPGKGVRPMLDRVKTALFDLLGDLEGARVLDLFAGTGSLGLEALSRGAASCEFVETNASALEALRRNLESLGFRDRAGIVRADAFARTRVSPAPSYDLVFFDPPYEFLRGPRRDRALALLADLRERLLAPGGRLVAHYPRGLLRDEEIGVGESARVRVYGTSTIAILEKP